MAVVPTGAIEDHHGMGIGGDLAADLAEVMVHRGGISDRHDQRRRLALRRADRTKHIGRGKAEVLGAAGRLPVYPHTPVKLFFWPMRASSLHKSWPVNGVSAYGSACLAWTSGAEFSGPGRSCIAATAASPYMRSGQHNPAP